ncbi:hypothetical protein [Streptomyces hypolithicus]
MGAISGLLAGAVAGGSGTTALNAVTYLDMAVRARGASGAPEDTIEALAGKAGVSIPGDQDERANRLAGLGPLSGLVVGVGIGAGLGLARSLGWRPGLPLSTLIAAFGAMASADGPIAALGVSDPRTWTVKDWAADVIPHLAYGAVTAAVVQALDQD